MPIIFVDGVNELPAYQRVWIKKLCMVDMNCLLLGELYVHTDFSPIENVWKRNMINYADTFGNKTKSKNRPSFMAYLNQNPQNNVTIFSGY